MQSNWKLGRLDVVVAAALSIACLAANAADDGPTLLLGGPPVLLAQKSAATTPETSPAADRMDINKASEAELASLPGIGEVRAKAIAKGRPYARKDELVKKNVLSEGVYEKIQDRIIAKQK